MNDLVSIVFTSYNHDVYLRQALDSLLNQTYINIEIIVIDDCSSDQSRVILENEYKKFPNIKLVLLQNNTGSYVKASNLGSKYASGKFIMFAQCDDYAECDQIEQLVEAFYFDKRIGVAFSKSNLVNHYGETYTTDFSMREIKFRKRCQNDTLISGVEMREYLHFSCVIPNLSAALINREIFNRAGGFSEDLFLAGDWELWYKIAHKSYFYYLSKPLNNFRQHDNTIRSTIKIANQISEVYSMFYDNLKEINVNYFERIRIKIGAGAVWFSYFVDSPKVWLINFGKVSRMTLKYERISWIFLFFGASKHLYEFLVRNRYK